MTTCLSADWASREFASNDAIPHTHDDNWAYLLSIIDDDDNVVTSYSDDDFVTGLSSQKIEELFAGFEISHNQFFHHAANAYRRSREIALYVDGILDSLIDSLGD